MEVPSLLELCLQYLLENLEDVESFEGIDSALKANLLGRVFKDKNKDSLLGRVLKLLDENTVQIDLSEFTFKDTDFLPLLSKMTKLSLLTIHNSPVINDTTVDNLFKHCPALQDIRLYKNPRITDRIVVRARQSCPLLTNLQLRYCIGISGRGFCSSTELDTTKDSSKLDKNKKIPVTPPPTIAYFTHLTSLDISECKSIIPSNLIPFQKYFPVLETVAMGKLFLGDEDAEAIINSFPPTLTSLDISFNPISFRAIQAVCIHKQFVSLNFSSCKCIINNPQVDYFSDIIANLPELTALDISQCCQYTQFFSLLQNSNLPIPSKLKFLDISNCGITSATLENLASLLGHHSSLQHINLCGCDKLNDNVLLSMCDWFPKAEVLDLANCKSVLTTEEAANLHLSKPRLQFRTAVLSYMEGKRNEK